MRRKDLQLHRRDIKLKAIQKHIKGVCSHHPEMLLHPLTHSHLHLMVHRSLLAPLYLIIQPAAVSFSFISPSCGGCPGPV